jgi:hypothetical protein
MVVAVPSVLVYHLGRAAKGEEAVAFDNLIRE